MPDRSRLGTVLSSSSSPHDRTRRIGNHTFRATGITVNLKNRTATRSKRRTHRNHESPRTPKLYDRCQNEISLDEVERILI